MGNIPSQAPAPSSRDGPEGSRFAAQQPHSMDELYFRAKDWLAPLGGAHAQCGEVCSREGQEASQQSQLGTDWPL